MSKSKGLSRLCCGCGRVAVVGMMTGVMAAVVLTTLGCGKAQRDRSIVTGKVTYNGEPLRFGTVVFQPESGQYAVGLIQPDGTFQMTTRGEGDGVPVGRNKVRFACFSGQDPEAKAAKTNSALNEASPMGNSLIPQKYLSCSTSGFVADVKPGNNEPFIFNLTDN